MLRTAIVLLLAALMVILLLPFILVLWVISLFRPGITFNGAFGCLARIFIPFLLKLCGVRFEVSGAENLPENAGNGPGSGAVYVGNHQGGFDALVPILYIGKTKSVVLKKEIARVPLAGWALKLFGCIFLDRTNLRAQIDCIRQMETMLRDGKEIAIFPEGTRSKGPDMGEFKAGAFRAAIAAGVPVVPFVIDGSWRCFEEKGRLVPATVQVSILPPCSTEGLTASDARSMAVHIREIMQQEQFRLRAEKGNNNA